MRKCGMLSSGSVKIILIFILFIFTINVPADDGRIDILPDGKSTFVISRSGSYVLVGNVKMTADVTCIAIKSDDVFLDLGGHTIEGTGKVAGAFGITSEMDSKADNFFRITLSNGIVKNFGDAGVDLYNAAHVYNITAQGNKNGGIGVSSSSLVENCIAKENTNNGFHIGDSSVIRNCIAKSNSSLDQSCSGISASISCLIENNISMHNTSSSYHNVYGIHALQSTIRGNDCSYNSCLGLGTSYGIRTSLGVVQNNRCEANFSNAGDSVGIYGLSGCTITGNTLISNTASGEGATGCGILVDFSCRVFNNTCKDHGNNNPKQKGYGIYVKDAGNQIVENNCSFQQVGASGMAAGIYVEGKRNLIKGNHCTENTGPAADGSFGIYIATKTNCGAVVIGNTTAGNLTKGIKFSPDAVGGYAAANLTQDGIDLNGANNKNGTTPAANDTY